MLLLLCIFIYAASLALFQYQPISSGMIILRRHI